MTPLEAAQVLAFFAAAWPWADVDEYTADVWADALADVDARDAQDAARRLVVSENRPPSIARFRAEAAKVARDRTPALQAPTVTTDYAEAVQRVRAIRAGLRREVAS